MKIEKMTMKKTPKCFMQGFGIMPLKNIKEDLRKEQKNENSKPKF